MFALDSHGGNYSVACIGAVCHTRADVRRVVYWPWHQSQLFFYSRTVPSGGQRSGWGLQSPPVTCGKALAQNENPR